MAIKKQFYMLTFLFISLSSSANCAWNIPSEVISGTFASDFGIEKGDTTDRLPLITAVLFDKKILISDDVNERIVVYSDSGSVFKIVPWYINKQSNIVNPEYALYNYWDVQGYTSEGNIWIKTKNYFLKSNDGLVLKTSSDRPLELGRIQENRSGDRIFTIYLNYPDKQWMMIRSKGAPRYSFVRDVNGHLYGVLKDRIVRFDACGREIAKMVIPESKYKSDPLPADYPSDADAPRPEVVEEYGSPLLAPSGDVYYWKRTPTTYSILKWTWVDSPDDPLGGPDAPTDLKVSPSITGLSLAWTASLQDPGCVEGYEVERSSTPSGIFNNITTTAAGVIKYNDTGAFTGSSYYYRIRAKSSCGTSPYTAEISGKRP